LNLILSRQNDLPSLDLLTVLSYVVYVMFGVYFVSQHCFPYCINTWSYVSDENVLKDDDEKNAQFQTAEESKKVNLFCVQVTVMCLY